MTSPISPGTPRITHAQMRAYVDANTIGPEDNAATATALETARTLWGRLFDGTANVDGPLSDVTSITMSGDLIQTATAARVCGGATSWAVRNSANTNDNLLITDAGIATFRNQVQTNNGSTSAPPHSFSSETTLGMYRIAAGTLGLSVNGEVLRLTSTGLTHTGTTAGLAQSTTTGLLNVGSGSGSGDTAITIRGAAGTTRDLRFQSGTSSRWILRTTNSAESGSNAGSNLQLIAVDDSASTIDVPLTISRVAGGAITFATGRAVTVGGTFNHNATTANLVQSSSTAVVYVGTGSGSGSSTLRVRGAAGQLRDIVLATGNSDRWTLRAQNTAEPGADVGSDFQLIARTDAGVFIDTVMQVGRAAGSTITFSSARPITGGTFNGQTISSTANLTGTLAVATSVTAPTFIGDLQGVADEADVLATSRNFSLTGDVTASAVGFDGSGNVALATSLASGVITNAHINAAAAIVDSKLATISTAGKVSNSATTATSGNTASAIVARDGSGNFSAGTITASLSGNASTATTAGTVTTGAQPNITSVGTLASLAINASLSSGHLFEVARSSGSTSVALGCGGGGSDNTLFDWYEGSSLRFQLMLDNAITESLLIRRSDFTELIRFFKSGTATVSLPNLPTSSAGLSAGDLWNDSGTVRIV